MALTPLKQRPATAYRRIPIPNGSVLLVPNRSVEPGPEPEPPFTPPTAQWDINTRGRTDNDFYEHQGGTLEASTGAPPVDATSTYDALVYNGINQYTRCIFPAAFTAEICNADFTLAMRLAVNVPSVDFEWWAGFGTAGVTGSRVGFSTGADSDTKVSFVGDNGTPTWFGNPDPDAPQDGTESVVVFRRSGVSFSIWKDGVKVLDETPTVDVLTADNFEIAAQDTGGGARWFYDGKVYWVAVWDSALTDQEVMLLDDTDNPFADPPLPGDRVGVIGYEAFNGNEPFPLPDLRQTPGVFADFDEGDVQFAGHQQGFFTSYPYIADLQLWEGSNILFEIQGGSPNPGVPEDQYYRCEITTQGYNRRSTEWEGVHHWIGYAMYLENFPVGDGGAGNSTVLFQFHAEFDDEPTPGNDWSPVFGLRCRASDGQLVIAQERSSIGAPADVVLTKTLADINNRWVRVVWEFKCSATSGVIRLWFDDELVGEYIGQTYDPGALYFGYYKFGIYAAWQRFTDGGGQKIMHLDDLRLADNALGATYESVRP